LSRPGLYSWWVDDTGADDLSRALGHLVRPGLIYAGLAGATRWPSGKSSTNTLWGRLVGTLWGRLVGMHLGGRAILSTFRTSLGAILSTTLWYGAHDEARLTQWMYQRLRVIALPVDDADSLGDVETQVLGRLDPPLNLSKTTTTPLRTELSRLRRAGYGRGLQPTPPAVVGEATDSGGTCRADAAMLRTDADASPPLLRIPW
jgi:hypothetical protein